MKFKNEYSVRWDVVVFFLTFVLAAAHAAELKTQNVFLIVSDGLRWQEVFTGAEELLINKTNGGVRNVATVRKQFWRDTPEARREALLPFFWGEIARHGQLYGNQLKGSSAKVTNGKKFSYPGYNEIISGSGDPRINSNDKILNPNTNVFEWIQGRAGFKDRVVVFGSWDAFPYIFNCERSKLPVWPPVEKRFESTVFETPKCVGQLLDETTAIWDDLIFDSFLFRAALDHVEHKKPRVMFLGFGETDEWAHEGRYDLLLQSIHHVDQFVAELWSVVQSMPEYRDKTTFILTCDHGRGSGPSHWRDHGGSIDGAENIWLGILGPDTPALGERTNCAPVMQSQIASTLAALVGEDYGASFPRAGKVIKDAIPVQ